MTPTQLKEALGVLDAGDGKHKYKPLIHTCVRCKLGVANPRIFLNGKPMHFPICLPNRLTR